MLYQVCTPSFATGDLSVEENGDPVLVAEICFFGSITVKPVKRFLAGDGIILLLGLFGAFDVVGEYCRTV